MEYKVRKGTRNIYIQSITRSQKQQKDYGNDGILMALVENLTKHGQKEESHSVSQGSSYRGGYIVWINLHFPAKDDGPDS
jgi:hypothetical protein